QKLPNNSIWSGTYKRTLSRKEQKQQFKSFFTVTKHTHTVTEVIDEELMKTEEEEQINKEISFYSNKSQKTPEKPQVKSDASDEDEEKLSPVLSQGTKKRISKFPRAEVTNPNVRVISRYFSRNKSAKSETMASSQESASDESLAKLESLRLSSQPSSDSMEVHKSIDDTLHQNLDTSGIETDQPSEKVNGKQEYTSCSDVEVVEVLECVVEPKIEKQTNDTSKRKKLGPCRTLGLKRTKSTGQKTTIDQLFSGFRKKSPPKLK
ncbi:unnamed protein product, partial [Callosobruchus maculatus]